MRCAVGLAAVTAAMLAACKTPSIPPSDPVDVEQVIRKIKQDLGRYKAYEVKAAAQPPANNACKGQVSFAVQNVSVALTTIVDTSQSASAGAKIPVGGIEFGPSVGWSDTRKSTQVLKFKIIPRPADAAPTASLVAWEQDQGFDKVLINLREALLRASDTQPCLTFPKEPKEQANSVEFGFEIVRSREAGGKLSFLIFSLGAGTKNSDTARNSVTITFTAGPDTIFIY